MRQQINLYNFLEKKTGFVLTTKFVLLSYTTFLMVLLLLHFFVLWQKHNLNKELAKSTTEAAFTQQQLSILTQKYPVTDAEALKKNIHKLQQDYEDKVRSIEPLLPEANFSTYLLGLAISSIPGVWLTQITFNREEPKIALKGYTLQPAFLEQFYSQLAIQPIFANMIFKLNELKQGKFPASFYITGRKVTKP